MRALFTLFPASEYAVSKDCYEISPGLTVLREFEGGPNRATNYDLGGPCCIVRDPFGKLFDLVDANMNGDA